MCSSNASRSCATPAAASRGHNRSKGVAPCQAFRIEGENDGNVLYMPPCVFARTWWRWSLSCARCKRRRFAHRMPSIWAHYFHRARSDREKAHCPLEPGHHRSFRGDLRLQHELPVLSKRLDCPSGKKNDKKLAPVLAHGENCMKPRQVCRTAGALALPTRITSR